jgi:hypothetical protein
MHIARKLLILAIIVLFSYIIYSLLQKRKAILSSVEDYYKKKEKEKHLEGFGEKDDPNYDAIMKDIKNISTKIIYQTDNDNKPVVYKNYNTSSIDNNKTLKDVFIKASYDSAFTGNYLSNEMIKFCLSQGCRFVDFEVDISNSIPSIVCKNNDKTNKTKSGTYDAISLLEGLKCTLDAAFNENSGSNYPIRNVNDPLFIHIRCSDDNYNNVYKNVLRKLADDNYYKNYLHLDSNNPTKFISVDPTRDYLSSYKKKAIIIVCGDDAQSNNTCNYKYDKSKAKKYSDIVRKTQPDFNIFQIVLSDSTELDTIKPNPDVFTSVKDRGYQVTCISYSNYLKEAYLTQNERKYENMFIDFNYSYMLMSDLSNYISNNPLYTQA